MADRINFLGLPVDVLTPQSLLESFTEYAEGDRSRLALYFNAHCVNLARADPDYRAALLAADLVYADGMSVVLASRLLRRPLPAKLTSTDFILPLLRRAAERLVVVQPRSRSPRVVAAVDDCHAH